MKRGPWAKSWSLKSSEVGGQRSSQALRWGPYGRQCGVRRVSIHLKKPEAAAAVEGFPWSLSKTSPNTDLQPRTQAPRTCRRLHTLLRALSRRMTKRQWQTHRHRRESRGDRVRGSRGGKSNTLFPARMHSSVACRHPLPLTSTPRGRVKEKDTRAESQQS